MEVRRVLEIQVVKLAAERATPENIDRPRSNHGDMCQSRKDIDVFSKWDLEFHMAIAHASENQLFEILIEPLAGALFEVNLDRPTTPGAS